MLSTRTLTSMGSSKGSYDDVKVEMKGMHSQFEDVKLEPNPAYGEVMPSQVIYSRRSCMICFCVYIITLLIVLYIV